MNNRLYAVLLLFCCGSLAVTQAKILRVGYGGPQVLGVDYASFQPAHNAADDGDTLMFYPGNYSGNASKRLIYKGYGYLVSGDWANEGLQTIVGTLSLAINLADGSSGSQFDGVGNEGYLQLHITDAVDDILIRRCYQPSISSSTDLDCSNWQIIQSYALDFTPRRNHTGTGRFINLLVENSYARSYDLSGLQPGSTGHLTNCILSDVGLGDAVFTVQNSIFLLTGVSGADASTFNNNIFEIEEADPAIHGDNNSFGISYIDLFHRFNGGSEDRYWELKDFSPARGAGVGGVDCGMYDGTYPYVPSGIPPAPVFYRLSSPGTPVTTNPFTVTFSIKSNN